MPTMTITNQKEYMKSTRFIYDFICRFISGNGAMMIKKNQLKQSLPYLTDAELNYRLKKLVQQNYLTEIRISQDRIDRSRTAYQIVR